MATLVVSREEVLEQALRNAVFIQCTLRAGGDPDRIEASFADDTVFLNDLLNNPGIMELERHMLDTQPKPLQSGGYDSALRSLLQREIRAIATERAGRSRVGSRLSAA